MARTATKFENHQAFGEFVPAEEIVSAPGLTVTSEAVTASDKETERSGEVNIPVYEAADLASALALYGGSDTELAKAAVSAYNDRMRLKAKAHVVNSIIGPEKAMAKTVKRVAKALGIDEGILKAKFADNPAYRDMILELAK